MEGGAEDRGRQAPSKSFPWGPAREGKFQCGEGAASLEGKRERLEGMVSVPCARDFGTYTL